MKKYDFETFKQLSKKNKLTKRGEKELYKYFSDRENNDLFECEITLNQAVLNSYREMDLTSYKNKYGDDLELHKYLINIYDKKVLFAAVN